MFRDSVVRMNTLLINPEKTKLVVVGSAQLINKLIFLHFFVDSCV